MKDTTLKVHTGGFHFFHEFCKRLILSADAAEIRLQNRYTLFINKISGIFAALLIRVHGFIRLFSHLRVKPQVPKNPSAHKFYYHVYI